MLGVSYVQPSSARFKSLPGRGGVGRGGVGRGLRPVCFRSVPFDGRRGFSSLRKVAIMMGTSVNVGSDCSRKSFRSGDL